MSATILRLRIVGALRSSKATTASAAAVSQNTVYTYPTIESLSNFLIGIVANPETPISINNGKVAIEKLIEKYSMGLDVPINPSNSLRKLYSGGETVLITGTTGNIGAQMLATLLYDDRVKRIFALNRTSSSSQSILQRQEARFQDKGLDKNLLQHSKLQLIEGDAAEDSLGLAKVVYETVSTKPLNLPPSLIHLALASKPRHYDYPQRMAA